MSLTTLYQIDAPEHDVFCARFGPPSGAAHEPQLLALGLSNGSIDVHTARDGRLLQTIAPAVPAGASPKASGLPVTCLRWRPASSTGGFRITDATTATRNVLLAAGSDGSLRHIHATSGRVLSTLYEPDTQLYACDYRPDGGAFASAGNAKVVRVYDEETRALKVELSGGVASASAYVLDRSTGGVASSSAASLSGASGHNNRIFAVAWHPTDENCIASAGWDNTVQIWDVRAGMAVRSIFGPHLGGDGLVFSADGTLLITASWRANDTLQVWDFASGELRMSVPWVDTNEDFTSLLAETAAAAAAASSRPRSNSRAAPPPPSAFSSSGPSSMLYAAALSSASEAGGPLLLAGGSGMNEAKIFSLKELLSASAPKAPAPPPLKGDAARSAAGRKSDAPSFSAPAPAPVVASVYGLARGVFTADWAGDGVFVVAGGDAGARVMRVALPGGRWPPEKAHRDGDVAGDGAWANGDSLEIDFGMNSPGKPVAPRRRVLELAAQHASSAAAAAAAAITARIIAEGDGGGAGAGAGGGGSSSASASASASVPSFAPGFASPTRMARGGAALRAAIAAREEATGIDTPSEADILAQYGGEEDANDVSLTTADNTPLTSPVSVFSGPR